ncbi:bifunctional fatty acid transporter and acyl-CoA synthetase [Leptodontidium sp. 2 PMI_412]|nr:bifunctional fatty acid transporter and acyl-CoA synthetase [Leptodontidium sp. 2 PMI_412]
MALLPSTATTLQAAATVLGAGYLNAKLGIGYDIRELKHKIQFGKTLSKRIQEFGDDASLYRMLEKADRHAEALWFEGRTLTWGEVKTNADLLAQYLEQQNIEVGASVGLYATNSPEMVIAIFAIAKIGAVSALLNTALKSDSLSHCINIAQTDVIIATSDFVSNIPPTIGSKSLRIFSLNLSYISPLSEIQPPASTIAAITPSILANLPPPITTTHPKRSISAPSLLIYTSGTTGHPKAVSIKNFIPIAVSTPSPLDSPSDHHRVYCCLPLFHATALLGLLYACGTSSTLIPVRKFSASRFSQDLHTSSATRMVYVGELCRYLLAAPPSPYDTSHSCKLALGNGLQLDIWESFKTRFNIPQIRELYRATEGLAQFNNFYGGAAAAGKVGFSGLLGRYLENTTFLVRYSPSTGNLIRDPETGFCIPCKPEEPGEAIGRVQFLDFYSEYFGDKKATDERFVRDVFKKGDLFQRSGDVLVRDRDGWVRFHERLGETFRWKGENVSAGEVKAYMSELGGVRDIVVYGSKIEGYDGQLGTAAITLSSPSSNAASESAFLASLIPHLKARGLPDYAIPRLIRFTEKIDTVATFKYAKEELKTRPWTKGSGKEEKDGDRLYWLDRGVYKPLDGPAWARISSANAKL